MKNLLFVWMLLCVAGCKRPEGKTPEGQTPKGIEWSITDETLTISGRGAIPDYENEKAIPWYNSRDKITAVIIQEGVTEIGNWAFAECEYVDSVTIPGSVKRIGEKAFYECRLTSVAIPQSLTSIGEWAFGWNRLTSITIPAGVTSIGEGALGLCSRLVSINVEAGNKFYTLDNGVLFNRDKTVLIACPTGKTDEHYDIPAGVKKIGEGAFSYCDNLTSISIPTGVTEIGHAAFAECESLTSVTIPNSVTKIGWAAFQNCISLTSVSIPSGLTAIEKGTFYRCSLTSITIPESITSIGEGAFYGCHSLTNVTVGWATPLPIEDNVFDRNSATLHVPAGAKALYKTADVWKDFKTITEQKIKGY